MQQPEPQIWSVQPGDEFSIESPEIGTVSVLRPKSREQTQLGNGRHHVVFVRPNGRMIGMNVPKDIEPEQCILVEDEEGYQHAVVGHNGNSALLTRRQPGEPDDWERRENLEMTLKRES